MDDELIVNFIILISNEERNLNKIIQGISPAERPDFEMTFTKAICKK